MKTPNQMPDEVVKEVAEYLSERGYGLTYLEMYYYDGRDKYTIQVGDSPFVLDKDG